MYIYIYIYIYPNDKGKTKELNASRSTSTSVEKGNLLEKKPSSHPNPNQWTSTCRFFQ
jgi:hypothetical protein